MLALFRAVKKASRPPAATIMQRRETYPPNERPNPAQNNEPPPSTDATMGFGSAFSKADASRRVSSAPMGALRGNVLTKRGGLCLPSGEKKWSADGTL